MRYRAFVRFAISGCIVLSMAAASWTRAEAPPKTSTADSDDQLNSPEFFSSIGIWKLRARDMDEARRAFTKAMDADQYKVVVHEVLLPLTPEAIRHGEEQVRKMLADRPVMAQGIDPKHPLYKWAVRKFAGEELGQPIDWDSIEPTGANAQNGAPTPDRRGRIRIRKTLLDPYESEQHRQFDEFWACAVFELMNINGSAGLYDLVGDVHAGLVDRDQYVRKLFANEFCALKPMRRFFVDVYLTFDHPPERPVHPARWYMTHWGSPEELLTTRYHDRTVYPWAPYLADFDASRSKGTSAAEAARYYRWAGELHLARKDYVSSLASFERALKQSPQLAADQTFTSQQAQASAGSKAVEARNKP